MTINSELARSPKKAEDNPVSFDDRDDATADDIDTFDSCSPQLVTPTVTHTMIPAESSVVRSESSSSSSLSSSVPPIDAGFARDGLAHTTLSTEFTGNTLEQLSNLGVESFQASCLEDIVAKEIDYRIEQCAAYANSHELPRLKSKRTRCVAEISRLARVLTSLLASREPSEAGLLHGVKSSLEKQRSQLSEIDLEIEKLTKELDLEAKKRCEQPSESNSENRGIHLNLDFGLRASRLDQVQQFKKRKRMKRDGELAHAPSEQLSFQEVQADNDAAGGTFQPFDSLQGEKGSVTDKVKRKQGHEDDLDDYFDQNYESRLRAWFHESRKEDELRWKTEQTLDLESVDSAKKLDNSLYLPIRIDTDLRIEKKLYLQLFEHQRVALKWLWELHQQRAGGILGDDMGLGKTIEVIAFLQALATSGYITKPILVIFPATVMKHWVREFHLWAPVFRVITFQTSPSGSDDNKRTPESLIKYCCHLANRKNIFNKIREEFLGLNDVTASSNSNKTLLEQELRIQERIREHTPVVLLCSYETLRIYCRAFFQISWMYAIMDEGQRLRNPDAMITLVSKRLSTDHRLILTGCPIQNNLKELWSLFDFCFPGKLGTLEAFESQFADPIQKGGYACATTKEVQFAYKCAVKLRDMVNPYLLRRSKDQVNIYLPKKNEQILFCRLTEIQRVRYRKFLFSKEADLVYKGKMNMLYGVDILRKICNHIWLTEPDHGASKLADVKDLDDLTSGSAKLKMLHYILELWKKENNRVLIFAQTIQMLNIIEALISFDKYTYFRMDGQTPVAQRQYLVDCFNASDSDVYIFILTTRVGGLGINLVSANRVIVFDPDWNPMTDLQARERAYRIGQRNDVTVYRFVVNGSIEEKIYQRQIFKQFLTQKILGDPKKTKSFFSNSDLRELFRLDERDDPKNQILFQTTEHAEKESQESAEDMLLKDLIGKGMASRLDHEMFLGGVTGEKPAGKLTHFVSDLIGQEAEKLAMAAVERLKKSRDAHFSSTQAPLSFDNRSRKKKPIFGSNSSVHQPADSLERLSASEQPMTGKALIQSMKDFVPDDRMIHTQDILMKLRRFLSDQPNREVSSEKIVEYFKNSISKSDVVLFRQLLRLIADFHSEKKKWVLKSWAVETGQ